MKITHNKVGQNLNLNDSSKTDKLNDSSKSVASNGVTSQASDIAAKAEATRVQLSDRAQEANRIKELAMAAPDVDEAKVAKFQKLIDDGQYKIDAKAIADRMVDEHLDF